MKDIPTTEKFLLQSQFDSKRFIKFPKIENLETEEAFPDAFTLETASFWFSEKIDGANLGMWLPLKGELKGVPSFYSRSGQNADGLFKFGDHKHQLRLFVEELVKFFLTPGITYGDFKTDDFADADGVYLWGEYYGDRINRRIDYGTEGFFKFYDLMIVKGMPEMPEMVPPKYFAGFASAFYNFNPNLYRQIKPGDETDPLLLPPVRIGHPISKKEDLLDILKLPIVSQFSPKGSNAEGFVITMTSLDSRRRWKLKDEKFVEKIPPDIHAVDPEYQTLHTEFMGYINENRAIGILSKTTERRVDRLTGMLLKDAREDFMADHKKALEGKDNKWLKSVFNVGALGFKTIKHVLAKEAEEK